MSSIGRQIASELEQDVKACGHPTRFGFMPKELLELRKFAVCR
jgi:hypothetical protein